MAFPSSSGATKSQGEYWVAGTRAAGMVKQRAMAVRDASLAGPVGSSTLLDMLVFFADQKLILTASAAVPGMAAYAQAQVNNPALNVAAEFTAMGAQLDATVAWAVANFPKDGSGFLLAYTMAADGRWVDRMFSTAALASLRTTLNSLIATID